MAQANKIALIDADLLLYGLACAFTSTFAFGHEDVEDPEVIMDLDGAASKLEEKMAELTEVTGCTELLFCFSCNKDDNYRYELYPNYKHNRKGTKKPELLGLLRTWVEESPYSHWDTLDGDFIEADDLLGLLAEDGTVVCSFDKDLDTIPGWHYDWRDQSLYEVSQEDADLFFWTQCLTGDPTDGYPGVPGVGPVKAGKLLEDICCEKDAWNVISKAYEAAGISQDDALIQCRLARILRIGEIDEFGKPILWVPVGYKE